MLWYHGPYGAPAKQAARAAILREVDAARAQGHPVIALRQDWSIPSTKAVARVATKGQAVAGSDGTGLADLSMNWPTMCLSGAFRTRSRPARWAVLCRSRSQRRDLLAIRPRIKPDFAGLP